MTTTIDRALEFLDQQGRAGDAAWARTVCAGGSKQALIDELAKYQNEDGGFGRNLEVDIKAPDSQPFAARMAMQALVSAGISSKEPIVQRLAAWLEREQGDDGCWRFPPGVYEHPLAPWFAGWTFPSLNPALDVAAFAHRFGIDSPRMQRRVAALADQMASLDEVETGDFYTLLPYAEYFPWAPHPRRDDYVAALARRIEQDARDGKYGDAGHFFEHVGSPDGELARLLPADLISPQLDHLAAEQEPDGSWPTPYDPAWRSWATAGSAVTLYLYGRRGS